MGRFFPILTFPRRSKKPDAVSLPEQAFDAKGDIKPEFYEVTTVMSPTPKGAPGQKLNFPRALQTGRFRI